VDQKDITKTKEAVAKSLGAKFANKGDFARQIRKAKRYLPRKTIQQAAVIERAESDLRHPQMRKLVDQKQVAKAKRDLIYAANQADPTADRSKFWFSWASRLVINLIIGMAVIFVVAKYLGVQ
jgi:meiotically up-regulated gene 157 (Mug157) protein